MKALFLLLLLLPTLANAGERLKFVYFTHGSNDAEDSDVDIYSYQIPLFSEKYCQDFLGTSVMEKLLKVSLSSLLKGNSERKTAEVCLQSNLKSWKTENPAELYDSTLEELKAELTAKKAKKTEIDNSDLLLELLPIEVDVVKVDGTKTKRKMEMAGTFYVEAEIFAKQTILAQFRAYLANEHNPIDKFCAHAVQRYEKYLYQFGRYFKVEKATPDWEHGLSLVEQNALIQYTGWYYQTINPAIWSNTLGEEGKLFLEVSHSALRQIPSYEGVAIRDSDLPEAVLKQHEVGATVTYDGFTSTSSSPQWQWNAVSHRFLICAKDKGHYVDGYSQNQGEEEVLFEPGTKFKVLDKTFRAGSGGKTIFFLAETDNGGTVIADLAKCEPQFAAEKKLQESRFVEVRKEQLKSLEAYEKKLKEYPAQIPTLEAKKATLQAESDKILAPLSARLKEIMKRVEILSNIEIKTAAVIDELKKLQEERKEIDKKVFYATTELKKVTYQLIQMKSVVEENPKLIEELKRQMKAEDELRANSQK